MTAGPRRRAKSGSMRDAAVRVVKCLQDAGYAALFAGGCVRDMLMGQRPLDYDIATSATPDEVIGLFRRTQHVGAQFGVVLVRMGGFSLEVATFRVDIDYQDGRHPGEVRFTTAEEDAKRRDFTINGMFLDPLREEIIDYVDGQSDLKAGIIRAIGDPHARFAEDHLRMLRAIRFAARFDFALCPTTLAAIQGRASSITRISAERIREELEKILSHPSRARAFRDMVDTGLLSYLWQGAAQVVEHSDLTACMLDGLPPAASFPTALAVILHSISPDEAETMCQSLRCSNQTQRTIKWLLRHRASLDIPQSVSLADLKLLMAEDAFADLLMLFEAKLKAKGESLAAWEEMSTRARAIRPEDIAPPPFVTGHDLQAIGLAKGPAYAKILSQVYYAQLNGEVNSQDDALQLARRLSATKP